jgi:hypothetical protein
LGRERAKHPGTGDGSDVWGELAVAEPPFIIQMVTYSCWVAVRGADASSFASSFRSPSMRRIAVSR